MIEGYIISNDSSWRTITLTYISNNIHNSNWRTITLTCVSNNSNDRNYILYPIIVTGALLLHATYSLHNGYYWI